MSFEEFYNSIVPTEKSILDAVDEYTLYCFYTGIDDLILGKTYPAPYRNDPIPSFSVFKTNLSLGVEYWWKDHGKDEKGNIFKLIQKIEQLDTREQVFQKISDDFGLDFNLVELQPREKIKYFAEPKQSIIKIRVTEIPLSEAGIKYWKQFDISKELLNQYNASQIKWYWSYNEQQAPYVVPDPTFSYRIGEYYQIYSPYAEKSKKFRNDLPENYFFGYMQLPQTGDKLIIDKSCKDVIFCKRIGYDAICARSETTMLPEKRMWELKDRFKEIYIMLDSDEAGRRSTQKYLDKYDFLKPRFLTNGGLKDKTDTCIAYSVEYTKQLVDKLLNE